MNTTIGCPIPGASHWQMIRTRYGLRRTLCVELCLIHTMMRFAAIAVHILVFLALITKIMIRF